MPDIPIERALMDQWRRSQDERIRRIARAWQAYNGQLAPPFAVRPKDKFDDNVQVNYLRMAVDKGASFLMGDSVTFELDEDRRTREEDWLEACWKANRKMSLLHKLAINGGVAGHAFIKIVLGNARTHPYPRLVLLDPQTVTVIHDGDDIDTVRAFIIEYPTMDPDRGMLDRRQRIVEAPDGESWEIVDEEKKPDAARWLEIGRESWPYPFAPVVDAQNLPMPNEYWGTPDLEDDVIRIQRSVDFVLSNVMRIIRFHAHPKTWGKGFSARKVEIGVDDILLLDDQGELHHLEMTGDLTASIEYYRQLKEALQTVTRIPPIATGKVDASGPLSGTALRIHYGPLLELTQTKRMLYGDMLAELCRRLLVVGGFGEPEKVEVRWPEAIPTDPKEEAEVMLLHEQLGVSKKTIITKLGYDPDVEQANNRDALAEMEARMAGAAPSGGAIGEEPDDEAAP